MTARVPGHPVIPIVAVNAADGGDAAVQLVSMYQAQKKIHPRSVSGRFAFWRWFFVFGTQAVFYGLPWLEVHGRQAVLFDLTARRFFIFDLVLYPQDFIYLTGLLVISAFGLFLFTAVAGRLWCGFACPQTVYTEIFMWVERRFEGDRTARIKRDAAPLTLSTAWRKGGKHAVWVAIGLWTGFTFVGYFTPIRTLGAEALSVVGMGAAGQPGFGAWEWFWVIFYGLATYGNAGYLREQVCKYMCPYARFQSAMFDKDTMIVTYDPQRGEPRGSRPRTLPHADLASRGQGDCIDCTLCVQVCPTGIDIRQGLQYECISCTACIDVCDSVMDKMAYPRGLIRFDTQNGMAANHSRAQLLRRVLRPRVLAYCAVLLAIVVAVGASLADRRPFKVDVIRDRGVVARQVQDGAVENVYRMQVMNASESAQRFLVDVADLPGATLVAGGEVQVDALGARWLPVRVQMPHEAARAIGVGAHAMRFDIRRVGDPPSVPALTEKSTFIVPR